MDYICLLGNASNWCVLPYNDRQPIVSCRYMGQYVGSTTAIIVHRLSSLS
ncbi:MAG: hypothetical protein LBI28_04170 [Treponema sp.]|nr:hypothetical protein [Treponema sp.]